MNGKSFLVAFLVVAAANAQNLTNNNGTCLASSILTAYNLIVQNAAINNNRTCVNFFSTSGACVTVGSVATAMTIHNNWLAGKARDAQVYALQYINATVYWQTQNRVINSTTTVNNNTSWWNSFTNTLSGWWTSISNRSTSIFNTSRAWIRNVFSNNVAAIPSCLNAWGNITNGAYCLASSASQFVYSISQPGATGDLALGVDLTSTGLALANCEALIDNYCHQTFGISINNASMPFNQTFNWADGGMTVDQCTSLQTAKICGSSCQANLYNAYINLFQSYFIRFIPSQASSTNLGNFYNTTNTPNQYVAVQSATSGKSFSTYSVNTGGSNLVNIGMNSGQMSRNYIYGSAARALAILVSALFALMF